jgi:subtilase family serine protease
MNGTSSATPYTAGIVALMFEKKPTLTLGEVRALLTKNASSDPFTGIPPEPVWGSGKLDMKAVDRIFAAIE